ncbi:predicted protein [Clavispora lusitaniae ATCC 42720]|uniref:Uncharacterized protein n=1 Tax=Clavispora lusitaniae (strain ATCC 42720) TaxID=306902 RepID=C4YBH2_CLAL4|nr:uncharacterized protein CLUG_05550 [Clavispora lusitaniae ATCC 42720]EEQ41422.1 predicted protein [Clavispora lusitaniae ATCC 42720]
MVKTAGVTFHERRRRLKPRHVCKRHVHVFKAKMVAHQKTVVGLAFGVVEQNENPGGRPCAHRRLKHIDAVGIKRHRNSPKETHIMERHRRRHRNQNVFGRRHSHIVSEPAVNGLAVDPVCETGPFFVHLVVGAVEARHDAAVGARRGASHPAGRVREHIVLGPARTARFLAARLPLKKLLSVGRRHELAHYLCAWHNARPRVESGKV